MSIEFKSPQEALKDLQERDHAIMSPDYARAVFRAFDMPEDSCRFFNVKGMVQAHGKFGGRWQNEEDLGVGAETIAEKVAEHLGYLPIGLQGVGSRLRHACERISQHLQKQE